MTKPEPVAYLSRYHCEGCGNFWATCEEYDDIDECGMCGARCSDAESVTPVYEEEPAAVRLLRRMLRKFDATVDSISAFHEVQGEAREVVAAWDREQAELTQ